MKNPHAEPAGTWTPYAAGSWPPDGATVDVLLVGGRVCPALTYRHWDRLFVRGVFPFVGQVVGWRPCETK